VTTKIEGVRRSPRYYASRRGRGTNQRKDGPVELPLSDPVPAIQMGQRGGVAGGLQGDCKDNFSARVRGKGTAEGRGGSESQELPFRR